jgi:flagellar hook capping protein FlgD
VKRWGPALVVLLLLGGTAIAFATTERQKLEKTPFAVLHQDEVLSPVCQCKTGRATLALRFRKKHVLTVQIRDADGRVIRTLTNEQTVRNGVFNFDWNGRDDAGEVVLDGDYSPRIVLDNGREFDPPNPIRVDSVAPRATVVSYRPRVLRRSQRPRLHVRYRVNEAAHPILYVNGRRAVLGIGTALAGKFDWFGRTDDHLLRPGRYRLQLAAVDLAGNLGERTPPFVVRVRK